jgi:hypothetical protein
MEASVHIQVVKQGDTLIVAYPYTLKLAVEPNGELALTLEKYEPGNISTTVVETLTVVIPGDLDPSKVSCT